MSVMGSYGFEQDWQPDDARLASVQSQFDAVTRATLLEVGIGPGMHCWEVGAGHGSVAAWMGGVVGSTGSVWATDLDLTALPAGLPGCVVAERHDVSADPVPSSGFSLIHARLVLEHLADPAAALGRLLTALGPGGCVVVEDAAGLRFACDPRVGALDVLAPYWERAARDIGWCATYGGRLLGDLAAVGLQRVRGRTHSYHAPGGEDWGAARLGLARLRDAILDAGAPAAAIDEAEQALADPRRMITGPPLVTAWGYAS
jgi:SAM-dependent methyltransferase